MKNNEDIGKLFEEKLKDLQLSAPSNSWDFLEIALNKKEKKKRRGFLFWVFAGVSVVALLVVTSTTFLKEDGKNYQTTIKELDTVSVTIKDKEFNSKNEKSLETFKTDSSLSQENISDTLYPEKLSKNNSERKKLKNIQENNIWKEDTKTKTMYYYYNDDTKQTLAIDDPRIIDSILKNSSVKDSILK